MPEPRAPKPQRGDRYVAANIKYMIEFPTNDQKMALLPIIQTGSKRFDDLRSQMSREHDTLARKVDEVNSRLENLNQNFIEHLKSHI